VAQEREQILESAEAERQRLLERQESRRRCWSRMTRLSAGPPGSEQIIQRATTEAAEIRRSAEAYATRVLANLEE